MKKIVWESKYTELAKLLTKCIIFNHQLLLKVKLVLLRYYNCDKNIDNVILLT